MRTFPGCTLRPVFASSKVVPRSPSPSSNALLRSRTPIPPLNAASEMPRCRMRRRRSYAMPPSSPRANPLSRTSFHLRQARSHFPSDTASTARYHARLPPYPHHLTSQAFSTVFSPFGHPPFRFPAPHRFSPFPSPQTSQPFVVLSLRFSVAPASLFRPESPPSTAQHPHFKLHLPRLAHFSLLFLAGLHSRAAGFKLQHLSRGIEPERTPVFIVVASLKVLRRRGGGDEVEGGRRRRGVGRR